MTLDKLKAGAIRIHSRLDSERATESLAARLANAVHAPMVIALRGELGAGKTAFARAFVRALPGTRVDEDVPSPTFTLVQTYETDKGTVWHFDLYRIDRPSELRELGWDDAIDEGICLVEWPEKAEGALPKDRLEVRLARGESDTARTVSIEAYGAAALEYKDFKFE